jgi:ubiquinone/menaquinone biosynthesis C-methylase UbiE
MADNNSRMKKSNISVYDSEIVVARKPQEKDVVWFSEKLSNGGIALDCGCGHGYYLSSLACERIGLDISAKQLSTTRMVDRQILLIRADVEHLPFETQSIDYILAFGLIHHLPNVDKGLDEIFRILKKGGYLFIMDSNLDGLGPVYLIWRLTMMGYNLRGHFAEGIYPKLPHLEQYLKQNGFSIDVRTEHSFLFSLSSLLDVYISYVPFAIPNAYTSPFKQILLRGDRYLSKLLPYKHRLSVKIAAKLGD